MALLVVLQPTSSGEPTTQVGGTGKSKIVLESDLPGPNFLMAISELKHANARNAALEFAASRGMANPACDMPGAPYAVDINGDTVVDPVNQKIHRYRVDIPLSTRF